MSTQPIQTSHTQVHCSFHILSWIYCHGNHLVLQTIQTDGSHILHVSSERKPFKKAKIPVPYQHKVRVGGCGRGGDGWVWQGWGDDWVW